MTHLLVVQNNLVERLTAPLAIAARERGIAIHDISSRDDMSGVPPFPAGLNKPGAVDKVLVYGSIQFVHQWAALHPDLSKWVFWSPEAQSAAEWSLALGDTYHNSDGWETTVGEVIAHEIAERHYRPMTTTKKIAGAVFTPEGMAEIAAAKEIEPGFRLWSSEPKKIDAEVRCYVVDGRVVTASVYRLDGKMHISTDDKLVYAASRVAEWVASRYRPASHFVVDVGLVEDVWGVIEFNPIHSSGWYACDPSVFLDAYFKAV